eukprot:4525989-Pyramimonas_sp.AAC.1
MRKEQEGGKRNDRERRVKDEGRGDVWREGGTARGRERQGRRAREGKARRWRSNENVWKIGGEGAGSREEQKGRQGRQVGNIDRKS